MAAYTCTAHISACTCSDHMGGKDIRSGCVPLQLVSSFVPLIVCLVALMSVCMLPGGWVDGSKCSAAVEMFEASPEGGQWLSLSPLIQSRRLHGLAACAGKLYVFGGCCDDPQWYTDSVEVLDLSVGLDQAVWVQLPRKVPAAGELRAVTVDPYIFLFLNGRNVVRYDTTDDSHTTLSALPLEDWHCFDAVHVGGGHVLLLGGSSKGAWTSAVYDYDVRTDSWTALPPMPQAKRRCACVASFSRPVLESLPSDTTA